MIDGRILSISTDKGFGFIQPLSGGADVFFHRTAVDTQFQSLTIGQQVQFAPDESSERPRAKSVVTDRSAHRKQRSAHNAQQAAPDGKPQPQVAEDCDFGFVTKLFRRKAEGFISSNQGGREYLFAAASVSGQKKFFELVVGDYVRFVPQENRDDPKQPLADSVMVVKRHVPTKSYSPPRHPRSLCRKPTWR